VAIIFLAINCYHSSYNLKSGIILPVVMYGRETWFVELRNEHGWKICMNRVLRLNFL